MDGKKGSGRSVVAVQYDNDDENIQICMQILSIVYTKTYSKTILEEKKKKKTTRDNGTMVIFKVFHSYTSVQNLLRPLLRWKSATNLHFP